MLGGSPARPSTDAPERADNRPYLGSHRALSARTREFERLTEAAMRGVAALHASSAEPSEEPVVRRSPDRCIMQFGPVALTVAWLQRTLDYPADGELLVVVWRGVVAPGAKYIPDRTTTTNTPVRSATALWEEVLTAVAHDEPSWLWRPVGTDIGGFRSTDLAHRCVEQLRLAYAGGTETVPGTSATITRTRVSKS